jgi:hypothetical protein
MTCYKMVRSRKGIYSCRPYDILILLSFLTVLPSGLDCQELKGSLAQVGNELG